ncbi:DDE-type integrase/transposase/recombinase [Burkholderia metallica]|uniref:Mu transposase C-terminal domain-containing protein n=1 Tax=Burkholderia metallica TaxID=488729 RepID=UPI00157B9607|nr:Mu transposase C-terminal domain-containing protein [Burkholderia metallica]NTZ82379.1 DDE-type integrase/transposase/recombinase [Burkholderia metallica]
MARAQLVQRVDTGGPSGAVAVMPTAKVLALRARDPWREATDRARQVAMWRETVVTYVHDMMKEGVTQNNAVALLLERHAADRLHNHFAVALAGSAKAGRTAPSRSAICQWCALHREGGVVALLPEHKGRVVEAAGWWGPALEYFNAPSKPDMAAVHRRLTEVDGFTVSYDQVRNYLTGVPSMIGRNSPARIGKNLYRLTEKAFVRRSTENALPGDVYVADGYRADVFLAHPVTGDIWRPELTVALDMRSRFPVGWRADEHEGTYAVQNMWAECFARWNHVPPMLYVDNGSGHKNVLMSDEMVGFYARAGIQQVIHAIPGNPHGKGWVERFFRTVKEDFLKLWMPEFYCGDDMAKEAKDRITREVKAGRIQLPSLAQFADAFNAWLDRYANRPHPEDKHVTRAALWAQLTPIPPHANVTELKRQAVLLTVQRAAVQHGKRAYMHPELHAFNGQKIVMEYDLMDDAVAVMRTQDGRWICDAHLIRAIDAIAPNRLEEKRQARASDAIKRLERKMEEQKARAGLVIDAEAVADGAMLASTTDAVLDANDEPLLLDLTLIKE